MALKCFQACKGGAPEYTLTTNWGHTRQPNGLVTLKTSGGAELNLHAIAGSNADGTFANGRLTITIENATPEDAEYDPLSSTLKVKIDLEAGHDTVHDLVEVINAAGDFWVHSVVGGGDSISASTTGGGRLSGGTNTRTNFDAYPPTVPTSSDRYYYLMNFPLRVRMLRDNRWHTFLIPGTTPTLPSSWMMAHNNSICSPLDKEKGHTQRAGLQLIEAPNPQTSARLIAAPLTNPLGGQ